MNIVTVSREFGSGGRELGKRLADALGFAYYDKEIVSALAQSVSMDENYLNDLLEKDVMPRIPITFSRTISGCNSPQAQNMFLVGRQHELIKQLASKGDCVIVGRGADALLREFDPFSVFVYADMPSRIARCRARAGQDENLSDKELERQICEIDKARARNYRLVSSEKWGDMHAYRLCVNTTGTVIKTLVPFVADCAKAWFEREAK